MIFSRNNAGFGNLLILLADSWPVCRTIYKNVYDAYEMSKCIDLAYSVSDVPGEHPNSSIYINQHTFTNVHPRIRQFVRPTDYMKSLIQDNAHLLDGVAAGVHIRRGDYSSDSKHFKDYTNPTFFHCSDSGLEKFIEIINKTPGKVYLASDSTETKNKIKNIFGDKISCMETVFAHTSPRDDVVDSTKSLHDVYLEWFILSMCPKLYITGGNPDLTGFSTFSYTAAIYGERPFEIVLNN